nr:PREDICTED: odorant receptor 45a-like [Tribolium castaneum]|eukprot:XP_015837901.1 PREDICTED: odorant receptor 45a-like [Tribolium castaneum]
MLMSLEPDDISADSLKILWYTGLHPALSSRLINIYIYANLFLCSVLTILAIIGIVLSYTNNIFFVAECLVTIILMVHNIIRFYYALSFCGGVFFDLQPFTSGLMPSGCYVPEGWSNILMGVMWYITFPVVFVVTGTDALFCSLSTSLIIQFKLLNHKFKTLKLTNKSQTQLWNDLKELVDYHNFLLSYCEELDATFSGVFLLQFIISIAPASVSIFIFMQPGAWANRMKFITYFLAVITETTFYCLPLDIVVNTASQVSDAIYESKWYEVDVLHFKKCLTLVIARAQKSVRFTGFGMVYINLRTFLIIWKTVFTFYTYLNSAKKITK